MKAEESLRDAVSGTKGVDEAQWWWRRRKRGRGWECDEGGR